MHSSKVASEGKRLKDLIVTSLFLFTAYQIRASESRTVGCGGKPADVVFLLDASNSIWGPHFRRQLQFVKDVIDWFPVGRDSMRVALVTYADYPQLQFALHDHFAKPQLHSAVDAVRQNGGHHTRTGRALAYARRSVLFGGEEVRTGVTKVVIVVTDGLSDDRAATAVEARRTREAGVHVFAVGVGKDVDLEELDAIASSPSMYYTFLVGGYEGLSNIRKLLAIKTCEVTDPTTTSTTTTMMTTIAASTTATTTTSSTTTTATTTTTVASSHTTSENDSNTVTLGKNQTHDKDDDNKGDYDDDGSESVTNETMRTPVILPPPTFIPNPQDTSPLAEFKVPDGENDPTDASFNCSDYFVSSDQDNQTGKDNDINNEVEKNQVSVVTKTPCYPNGGGLDKNNPKNGDIDGDKGSNRSDSTGRGGHWEYNEHGRWFGTRFVKMRNRNGSDTQALDGREETIQHDITTSTDESPVTEGDDKKTDTVKGNPDRSDPRYHVYFGSGPWGIGGYWYRDDVLGYVWYRYVSPGKFVLDMDTTNRIRAFEEEKRRKETSGSSAVNSGGEQGTTSGSDLRVTSEHQVQESTSKSGSEDEKVNPDQKTVNGYWDIDEHGEFFWYRKTEEGYIEKLYPQDVDQRSTDTITEGTAKSTLGFESDEKISHRPGSMSAESHPTTTTTTITLNPKDSGSEDVGVSEGDVEYDFWRFVRGRRVWLQYVPPNDMDENDEENRLRNTPTQAVEIPMDMASPSIDAGSEGQGQWKVVAEKRRAWKSWKKPGGGDDSSIATEELIGDFSDRSAKDPSTVRLDDEKGRRLWKQLVNLTDVKSPTGDSLSELETPFQVLKEERGKTELGNRSDGFHESYWFYDDTGRRFQVIHRYNVSSGDEFDHQGDAGAQFLPPQINPVAKWEHEETQVRGSHDDALRDSAGTQVREKYGGEYWIRALGSSKDESGIRKPVDTEALRSRTGLSIDRPAGRKAIQPKTNSRSSVNSSNHSKKKDVKGKEEEKRNKKSSRVGNRKGRGSRKSGEKRCRSKRPIFIVFALNATNNEHLNAVLNVAQTTVARLTEYGSTETQVRYYPDVVHSSSSSSSSSGHPRHASRAADRTTPGKTFTDVARIFRKDAADRKRAGKPRSRRILALLVDGRLPDEWQTTSGSLKRLPRDVEYLAVVPTGSEPRVERLERLADSLKPKRVIHDGLSPHSTSNSVAEKLVSAICWPLAKTR